jgi:CheY-like chemotaxis protein
LHGGEATAQSDGLGKGSVFTIALPLAASPSAEVHDHPPVSRHESSADAVNIMIVDDNIDAARSLAELLRSKGHYVIVAEDADRALSSLDKDRTQLFVLDIGLPGIDGYELARRLRSDPATADAVMIALTGYGQAHDRVLSKAAGFDHHFIKPADMTKLEEVLKKIALNPQAARVVSMSG